MRSDFVKGNACQYDFFSVTMLCLRYFRQICMRRMAGTIP
jgi:hypothetical protein